MKTIHSLLLLLSIAISGHLLADATLTLSVKGMHCGGCESKFKSVAAGINGVQEVKSVSAANSSAVLVYNDKTTSAERLIKALAEQTGYTVAATTGAAVTTVEGKPAACCMKGQNNPSCTAKEKTKCAKKKCDKTAE